MTTGTASVDATAHAMHERKEAVVAWGVGRLDDEDYPAVTMGQAAELLDVQPAFLRSLDAAGVLNLERSGGGHRRFSRRQLALAARMRALFDEGLNLDAAARIVELQDQVAAGQDELRAARERIAELEEQGPGQQSTPQPERPRFEDGNSPTAAARSHTD